MGKTRRTYRSYTLENWLWNLALNGQHVRAATLTRILTYKVKQQGNK